MDINPNSSSINQLTSRKSTGGAESSDSASQDPRVKDIASILKSQEELLKKELEMQKTISQKLKRIDKKFSQIQEEMDDLIFEVPSTPLLNSDLNKNNDN